MYASPLPSLKAIRIPGLIAGRAAASGRSKEAQQIGAQVRALRVASGASAGTLSRDSGVSRSMLSRIENGLVSPSVETLGRLAGSLGVPVSRLVGDQAQRLDFSHVPAGRGIPVERVGSVAHYRYELLGHQLSGNVFVEPYLVTLEPEAQPYTAFQHPGVKFIHLLTGRVVYRYGSKTVSLEPGGTLLFDGQALHGIEQILERPVSYLSVVSSVRG